MPTALKTTAIVIPVSVVDKLQERRALRLPLETGGFLMGLRRGKHIEVSEVTFQQPADFATSFSFERIDDLHTDIAQARWKESGAKVGLVGDWHSHLFGSGEASAEDRAAWRDLGRALSANVIGVILGDADIPAVYLHRHGRWPTRATRLTNVERSATDLVFQAR